MESKTRYFTMRLSEERLLQLEKLSDLSAYSKSMYLDRLISSQYYKFFDKDGKLNEDKEAIFNN